MIHQRFFPVSQLVFPVLEQCCLGEPDYYFKQQYQLDSSIVDNTIVSSENRFIFITDHLSATFHESDIREYIRSLKSEDKFLLYVAIRIVFLHANASTQKLPAIPTEELYRNLYAYLQDSYFSFKKYCSKNNLSMWYTILDYEYDLMCEAPD